MPDHETLKLNKRDSAAMVRHAGGAAFIERKMRAQMIYLSLVNIADADQKWNEFHYEEGSGALWGFKRSFLQFDGTAEPDALSMCAALISMSVWWGVHIHHHIDEKSRLHPSLLGDLPKKVDELRQRTDVSESIMEADAELISDIIVLSFHKEDLCLRDWLCMVKGSILIS